MNGLDQYLSEHKGELVDEVEAEVSLVTLANELVRQFPMSHGGIDKAHMVWSRCLRDALWLGWLSEAKRQRGAYSTEICMEMARSISQAFRIGTQYAIERP
jgi:hypothetical protein